MKRSAYRLRAAGGLFLFLLAPLLRAVSLTRGPSMGRPADSAVAVSWRTDSESDSRVDYALGDGPWSTVGSSEPTRKHVVVLTDLVSGAEYQYRIYSDGVPLAGESSFRAPRSSTETRFRFAVIGDTDRIAVPTIIADRLAEADVDFAVHTGDVVYPSGADEDYDAQFFVPFGRWLRRGPVLPTLGNHDIVTANGAPYLDNFVLPANGVTHESRFYAFRHANALFVCLDVESSPYGAGSPQYEWLVRTLRQSTDLWKFVYFHTPAYSSAQPDRIARLVLSPLIERYGVDVVFSGHEHLYERTYPIRDFVNFGPGVIYVTEGGGGASLTPAQREDYSAFLASRFGYLIVEIDGGRLSLSARDPDGSIFDLVAVEKNVPASPRMTLVPPSALARIRHTVRR